MLELNEMRVRDTEILEEFEKKKRSSYENI